MEPEEINQRRQALGLSKLRLAALAALDETTVGRVLKNRGSGRLDTLRRLAEAIKREELTLRDRLIDLHGLPDRESFIIDGTPRRVVKPTVGAHVT